MFKRDKHIYVGLDLHKFTHTAVIVDCWGEKIDQYTFMNKPSIFPLLINFVQKNTAKDITPVFGLEDVGGYGRSLAQFLIKAGYIVKAVNPALAHTERKNQPMIKKNDNWDAQCVAVVLANRILQLPDATCEDVYWTIAQLVGRRNTLVKEHAILKNQLHMQLSYHYPSYKKFFADIDGKTALAFWKKYPSPHTLVGVTLEELTTFLRTESNNTCSTKKAEEILEHIEFDGETKLKYQTANDKLIQSIVRNLNFHKTEMEEMEKEMKILVSTLDYKLETMPGIKIVTSSALIAEIGDIHRFSSADKLARYAGIAPTFFGSGGKGSDKKSKQGNRVLHSLFYNLAVQHVQIAKGSRLPRNPLMLAYYEKKQAEGKSKSQALVCVMRKLVNIIYGMMKTKTPYKQPEIAEKQAV